MFAAGVAKASATFNIFSYRKTIEKVSVTTVDGSALSEGIQVSPKFVANFNHFYSIDFLRPASINDGEYTVTAEITDSTNIVQANFNVLISSCKLSIHVLRYIIMLALIVAVISFNYS